MTIEGCALIFASSRISDPLKTGFQAVKLASWIFIMPFLFVYTPLLLSGTLLEIIVTVVACMPGIIGWAGWMDGGIPTKKTTGAERVLLFLSSVCLLLPIDHLVTFVTSLNGEFHYPVYLCGAALLLLTFLMQRARAEAPAPATRPAT